jgi:hypothetical protein
VTLLIIIRLLTVNVESKVYRGVAQFNYLSWPHLLLHPSIHPLPRHTYTIYTQPNRITMIGNNLTKSLLLVFVMFFLSLSGAESKPPLWICCKYCCHSGATPSQPGHITYFCHPSAIGPICPPKPGSSNSERCTSVKPNVPQPDNCQDCVNNQPDRNSPC